MKPILKIWILGLVALLLGGCASTVDQMYCLPKRSEEYQNLQSAMDKAMSGLDYCAPVSGENQQSVQTADLNGDGEEEYLVFAKGGEEKPLNILVFTHQGEGFVHTATIQSEGTAFDQVEYIQMDDKPGLEIVVGCQLTDQLPKSVSVYQMDDDEPHQILSTNYTKFLCPDLDENGTRELFILAAGDSNTDSGIATLYYTEHGVMTRSKEVNMSEPAANLKRIITGRMFGGIPAVYVASAVDENAIITDIYTMLRGELVNVTFSNESGTSIQTLRNHYIYACDIDQDGVVELPDLMTTEPMTMDATSRRHYFIRWYAMAVDGAEIEKMYTFHSFVGGWYLQLGEDWARRMTVDQQGNTYSFYIWDEDTQESEKIFTIYALSGTNREEQAGKSNRFVLYRGETVIYACDLEVASAKYDITQEGMIQAFQLIRTDWNTGET